MTRVVNPDPVFLHGSGSGFQISLDPGSGSGFQISLDPDPVSVLGSWIPDPDRDPRRTETAPIVIS